MQQRVEIKELVLSCPARRGRANLKKIFPGFQGIPLGIGGDPSLLDSLRTSKKEHVSFPPAREDSISISHNS